MKSKGSTVRAIFALYREFEQRARAEEMSMAQYRILLYLRNGPKRAGAIAATYEVTRPTVSLALSALREKGWIANVIDPVSQRFVAVAITTIGVERMLAFEAALGGALDDNLPAEVLAGLGETLEQAYVALGITKEERLRSVEADIIAGRDERIARSTTDEVRVRPRTRRRDKVAG